MPAVISSSVLSPDTQEMSNFCLDLHSLVLHCVAGECGIDPIENRNLTEVLHALIRVLTLLISVMISHCITW